MYILHNIYNTIYIIYFNKYNIIKIKYLKIFRVLIFHLWI